MNKTSLYQKHVNLEAKILEYAGYMMPINYKNGIQYEYNAIRNNVGVFDVSHMGEIFISGKDSKKILSKLTVNNIDNININQAQYTAICNENGGVIDDIILYKLDNYDFMLIVNASNLDKVYNWFLENNKYDCKINDRTNDYSLLALQGPKSREILKNMLNKDINLKFYHHDKYQFGSHQILVSRTGYTGELGYEILGKHNVINKIWDEFINKEVIPCGLAVRDVLRLEMKYCLYGNDINEKITPIEAGLKWIVNNTKDYIGKNVIEDQIENGVKEKLMCIKMIDKSIPRTGYEIFFNNEKIGKISSGTFSTKLKSGIAMAYIRSSHNRKNSIVDIKIRGKYFKGEIVNPPFINNFSLHK